MIFSPPYLKWNSSRRNPPCVIRCNIWAHKKWTRLGKNCNITPTSYLNRSSAKMTIDTTCNAFSEIVLDERNRPVAKTPTKTLSKPQSFPITPDTEASSDLSLSSSSSVNSEDEPCHFRRATVSISEHKRDELEGRHAEEPLLKDNPRRFVLFPIKEPEVSRFISSSTWQDIFSDVTHLTLILFVYFAFQ